MAGGAYFPRYNSMISSVAPFVLNGRAEPNDFFRAQKREVFQMISIPCWYSNCSAEELFEMLVEYIHSLDADILSMDQTFMQSETKVKEIYLTFSVHDQIHEEFFGDSSIRSFNQDIRWMKEQFVTRRITAADLLAFYRCVRRLQKCNTIRTGMSIPESIMKKGIWWRILNRQTYEAAVEVINSELIRYENDEGMLLPYYERETMYHWQRIYKDFLLLHSTALPQYYIIPSHSEYKILNTQQYIEWKSLR